MVKCIRSLTSIRSSLQSHRSTLSLGSDELANPSVVVSSYSPVMAAKDTNYSPLNRAKEVRRDNTVLRKVG
jgi:hypothetical protein